ncbi:PEP-CTERM sorting domain-containing protein [Agarivorans sp. DSG3-1]|uniref:PEP-CTERM sorting domain-containing protein n=1 Tax=Agarivorans sp. DSG3-1 TaxID=3342249 RepID=UPI00398F4DB8
MAESSIFTAAFPYDVFAIGFDVNELNSSSLRYLDTAFTSFSITGSGSSSGYSSSVYGFDALAYTAALPTPASLPLMSLGLFGVALLRRRKSISLV